MKLLKKKTTTGTLTDEEKTVKQDKQGKKLKASAKIRTSEEKGW
jgi:hypothetical protein